MKHKISLSMHIFWVMHKHFIQHMVNLTVEVLFSTLITQLLLASNSWTRPFFSLQCVSIQVVFQFIIFSNLMFSYHFLLLVLKSQDNINRV